MLVALSDAGLLGLLVGLAATAIVVAGVWVFGTSASDWHKVAEYPSVLGVLAKAGRPVSIQFIQDSAGVRLRKDTIVRILMQLEDEGFITASGGPVDFMSAVYRGQVFEITVAGSAKHDQIQSQRQSAAA